MNKILLLLVLLLLIIGTEALSEYLNKKSISNCFTFNIMQ